MIRLENVRKIIQKNQYLNIDKLKFESGNIYAILGHNGSGKSTLLKLLYDIESFKDGRISIESESFKEETIYKYIAYSPQKPKFLSGTLQDNFNYLYKYSRNKDLLEWDEVYKLLEEFDLIKRLDTDIKKLSGGEQAKAQFIRNLAMNKKYSLFDEPTASLDFNTIKIVEEKIKELKRKGKCVILITHDFLQAKKLADSVILMENLNMIGQYDKDKFFKEEFIK